MVKINSLNKNICVSALAIAFIIFSPHPTFSMDTGLNNDSYTNTPVLSTNAGEAFKVIFENSKETALKINNNIKTMDEKNKEASEYFLKNNIINKDIERYKKLFDKCFQSLEYYYKKIPFDKLKTKEDISKHALIPFCHQIYLMQALQDAHSEASPNSAFKKDIDELLKSFSIFQQHFLEIDSKIFSYLKIEPTKRGDDNIMRYSVTINIADILFDQKKKARNILNTLEKIKKIKIEQEDYKQFLMEEVKKIEFSLNNFINTKITLDYLKKSGFQKLKTIDLSSHENNVNLPTQNLLSIIQTLEKTSRIVFNPLKLQFFSEKEKGITLSFEERVKHALTLQSWSEKPVMPKKKPEKKTAKKENQSSLPSTIPTINQIKDERISASPMHDIDPEKKDKEDQQAVIMSPLSKEEQIEEIQNPIELKQQEMVIENLEETPESITQKYLDEIIEETKNKGVKFFCIFSKALSLHQQLLKHPYLIDQIQEGLSNLLDYFHQIKNSTETVTKNLVPKNSVTEFRYFMDTPLCYLKELRFGFVSTLLRNLGVYIDEKKEGSRIGIGFKEKKTSIHLHDSRNGKLDGGRIVSLRKFILECGFTTPDN